MDIGYEKEYDEQIGRKKIHYRTSVDKIDADLVLLMDVLEHVEDDLGLLSHYIEKVPKGARFLILVPAFQFLWSQHDVFVKHVRRYTFSETESLVKKAGLKHLEGWYFYGTVFPIAATLRLYERYFKKAPDKPQSQLQRHS